MKDNIVAIIIARGGSKSIPRKNVLPLKGKPLVAWPVDLAKSIPEINRVIISTDDDEIMSIAKEHGAEVLFKRPPELADDETTTLPVLQHCLRYLMDTEGYRADIVLLLYPTAPFLKKERIIEALHLFERTKCKSVVSAVKDWGRFWKREKNNVYRVLHPEERVNRQYYEPLLREDGAVYFSRFEVIMDSNQLVDKENVQFLIMEEDENVDIDTPRDLAKAEERRNE